jgi:hypothetical protein
MLKAGIVVLLGLLVPCAGCSSSSASGAAGPGSDGGKGQDAGDAGESDGAGGTACLASAPKDGSMCGPQGLVCEYGTATVEACDTVATCNGGRWQVVGPGPGGLLCMSGPASECPASLSTVQVGAHCSPLALVCDYPDGRCACDVRTGAPVTDASAQATWICPSPDPSCPMPRPRLGAACSSEGLSCDYGTCAIPGATAERCTGGIWVQAVTKCGG